MKDRIARALRGIWNADPLLTTWLVMAGVAGADYLAGWRDGRRSCR